MPQRSTVHHLIDIGTDGIKFCKTVDAKYGVGLALAWPSIGKFDAMVTGEIGSYSRLIGGAEDVQGDSLCTATNEDGLWVSVDCGKESRKTHAVCVKRNCIDPSSKDEL